MVWLSTCAPNSQEEQFGEGASRHASGRLARRSPLEDVTSIVKIKLLCAGKVGMAGTRGGEVALGVLGAFAILDGQGLFPIFPVAVLDAQGNRCANGLAMANACEDVSLVLFDALTAAAAKSQLTAVQLSANEIQIDGNTSREPGDPSDQRLSVGLTGRYESQHDRWGLAFRDKRKILPEVSTCVKASRSEGQKDWATARNVDLATAGTGGNSRAGEEGCG